MISPFIFYPILFLLLNAQIVESKKELKKQLQLIQEEINQIQKKLDQTQKKLDLIDKR